MIFLLDQVEAIKKIAEYVTQLRLVGKGHGMTFLAFLHTLSPFFCICTCAHARHMN